MVILESLVTEWATTAIINAPVLVFMVIAIWDLRRSLNDCSGKNDHLVERLIQILSDDDENHG